MTPPTDTPTNRRPILMCEGTCGTVTPHTFQGKRSIVDTGASDRELLFSCDKCEALRRWGLEG